MSRLQCGIIPHLHYVVEGCTWPPRICETTSRNRAFAVWASPLVWMRCSSLCWSVIRTGVIFFISELWREQTRYFPNDRAKCLRDSGGDTKMEFHCSVNEVVNVSRSANLLKRQIILRASVGKATASLGICVRPPICPLVWPDSHAVDFRKNLVFGICSKLCPPIAILVTVGENSLYITSYVHLCGCSL